MGSFQKSSPNLAGAANHADGAKPYSALQDLNERSVEIFRRIVEDWLSGGQPIGSAAPQSGITFIGGDDSSCDGRA